MNQIHMRMGYHVWGAMMKRCQSYTPKLTNIAELGVKLCEV